MNRQKNLSLIIYLFLLLGFISARGQAEVKFTNDKDLFPSDLIINPEIIKKQWFLYYPSEPEEAADFSNSSNTTKDMHAAQINCRPSSGVTGHLQCSVTYYLQGRNEDHFAGKGYAFEVSTEIDPTTRSDPMPVDINLKPSKVHSSKLIDPVLIRYENYSFVIGRKSCAPDTVSFVASSPAESSTPESVKKRDLIYCGVGLSMKKEQESGELSHWTDMDDISFSNSNNVFPEVFWQVRGDHLILGGREWQQQQKVGSKNHEVSTATYMKKANWVPQIKSAIKQYDQQKDSSNALSELKTSISRAFSNFKVFPMTWEEKTFRSDSIMNSSNYVTLQPDIIFYNSNPDLIMAHLRTRINFSGSSAKEKAPPGFAKLNGFAYSVILKCGIYPDRINCSPLSVFDNPWTKNTLQTFNGDNKQLYFIGDIAQSRAFNPGPRNQLFLYKTDLYKNFSTDEFSSNAIDQPGKTSLLEVPPANSQFISDTTYPFFDPLTTHDTAQKCALFVTTVRTEKKSGIAILCLDKDKLKPGTESEATVE
ncbi:hypothetical protein [Endozoicomonas euniceicola]|uniref:Uncharacterized protein n=1 Tax=Endozoicomonas euniceicola TaxID=1234143 RepID=A0ABY6GTA0_9GAMM|nr:hypothetical protein [Endozoicomonas euniceicola]UYM15609.1 hypothetical protein NX720_22675 [Endozoicomonas euniceicola]